MQNEQHPKKEQTLVILKPDAIQRGLIGEMIKRFEQTGLKIIAMKFIIANESMCWEHYNKDEKWFKEKGDNAIKNRKEKNLSIDKSAVEYGKDIIRQLVYFMTSGPVVPIIFEGNQASGVVKKIIGSTEPLTSDVGTIRGDYTIDSYSIATMDGRAVRNLIHASESAKEAEREIKIWFTEDEILKYNLAQDKILYDVNLDGIKE